MGEGSCFSPWVDTPYLRDRFRAPSAAPGVRTLQRAGILFDRYVGFVVRGEEGTGRRLFLSPGPHTLWKLDRMRCDALP